MPQNPCRRLPPRTPRRHSCSNDRFFRPLAQTQVQAPHKGSVMAERSFVEEVKKLRVGAGEVFSGEGILAVTKALLESGVAYVAGYQGAPISHLMDVLADAQDILSEHGIRFENSASEATAAATLAASV